jgi:predicted PurR-regulated permease PerM
MADKPTSNSNKQRIPANHSALLLNLACLVIIVAGVRAAANIIALILMATFLAIVLTPLYVRLQKWRLPSGLALLVVILIILLVGVMATVVVGQSVGAFVKDLPTYETELQARFAGLIQWADARGMNLPEVVKTKWLSAENLIGLAKTIMSELNLLLGNGFWVLLILIFMLFEVAVLPGKVRAMPGMDSDTWERLERMVNSVRRYTAMKSLLSLLTMILVVILTASCRVPYAMTLGILAGLMNFVPTIGSIIAAIPGILLALLVCGSGTAVGVTIGYVVINNLITNFIEPKAMGQRLGLSPVVIVISLVVWGWALGPVGMFLSVPLTMVIKIALESMRETEGVAVLMGSGVPSSPKNKTSRP